MRSAAAHRNENFIGIEQDWQRINKAIRRISRDQLTNVRLLAVDAFVAFQRLFNPKTVDQVYCLFPCPWPKKKHIKHRLFSNEFLKLVNSRLIDQGSLKIVTDFLPYRDWILEQESQSGFRVHSKVVPVQYDTKYERKWADLGQRDFFELQLIKEKHISIPVQEDMTIKEYLVETFNPERFHFLEQHSAITVVFKDLFFDSDRDHAMVHLIVSEGHLLQHVWVTIAKFDKHWVIRPTEGHPFIPTLGVAKALDLVKESCLRI